MKTFRSLTLATLLATSLTLVTANANTQQKASPEGTAIKGKVTAVDASAQTVVINGQTFQVLPTTRITSNEKTATINDLEKGEQIAGQYKQSAENKLELLSLEIIPAVGGSATAATSEQGARFSGKVSKVDADAKTVTVGNQTYHVLPSTRITTSEVQPSFEDIEVGAQLTGQYKQSAENKREVLTVKIASAVGGTDGSPTSEQGARFSGKVSKVDPEAKTVTVGNQTYHVLPSTRITTGEGQADFEDIQAGAQLTGQYKQSAENRRELLSVEIPEAVGGTSGSPTSEQGARFSGKISKVDPEAKTVTVRNQTYHVLPSTRITSGEGQADFKDLQAGVQLTGQYKQSAENRRELLSVEIPEAGGGTSGSPTSEQGARFSGKISKIDPAAQTLTVGNRTFHLLPTTAVTTATGQPSTLATMKANQQVNGTYKQSANGKLELLSLQVGESSNQR